MKLPFVSRATHDDVKDQRDRAQADVRELTKVIIDMKVTGATVRAALTGGDQRPALKLARREQTPLDRALDDNNRTRNDERLAGRMRTWAEKEIRLADGDEEKIEAVLDRVRNWNAVADDDDDEAVTA